MNRHPGHFLTTTLQYMTREYDIHVLVLETQIANLFRYHEIGYESTSFTVHLNIRYGLYTLTVVLVLPLESINKRMQLTQKETRRVDTFWRDLLIDLNHIVQFFINKLSKNEIHGATRTSNISDFLRFATDFRILTMLF